MSYPAGLDLGSTCSALATCRPERGPRLETLTPTVVFANPDGSLLVGEDAERRAPADPGRVARRFTRRVGDATPLHVGGAVLTAAEVTARFAVRLLDPEVGRVAVTHPAGWGQHRVESLRAAFAAQGLSDVLFLSEPQAAVRAHASREQLEPGAAVAVYDLGGGSFDAAVVRVADGFDLVGEPEEVEVGGLDFDEVVFDHVATTLGAAWVGLDPTDPAVLRGFAELRRECTAAKERLSADTDVLIPVALPGITTEVRLARVEFEELIRPAVDETVAALSRVIRSAGMAPSDLAAVLLVGGSARVPLVIQEVSAQLSRPVTVAVDPQGVIAIGAALAARGDTAEPTAIVRPVSTRPPLPSGPPRADKRPRRRLVPALAVTALALVVAGGVAAASRSIVPEEPVTEVTQLTTTSPGTTVVDVPTTTVPPPEYTPPAKPATVQPPPRTEPPVRTTAPPSSTRPTTTTQPSPSVSEPSVPPSQPPSVPSSSRTGTS